MHQALWVKILYSMQKHVDMQKYDEDISGLNKKDTIQTNICCYLALIHGLETDSDFTMGFGGRD